MKDNLSTNNMECIICMLFASTYNLNVFQSHAFCVDIKQQR